MAPPAVPNEASTSSTGWHCVVAVGGRLQVEVLRCVSTTRVMQSSKQVLTSYAYSDPDERPSAAELRKHTYLELQPGWSFNGFK